MKLQLLSLPRSGSTYLYGVLRNVYAPLQQIGLFNEPFNHNATRPNSSHEVRIDHIQNIIQMSKNSTDIVLKNHIQHLDWLPDPSLVTEFKQVDWTTIVLLRRDLFKMALSLAVSEKTGQWMKYHDVPAFEIDSNDFKTSLDYVLDMTRAVIHNKYDFKYHQVIFYEGLSFNHQNDFNKLHISKYFDYERRRELLPNYPLFHDKLRWVNQAPAKEQQILNYHDLQTYSISILNKIRDRRFGVKGTKLVNVVCKMN